MAFPIVRMRFLFYRHIIPQRLVGLMSLFLSVSNDITLLKESATEANVITVRSKD